MSRCRHAAGKDANRRRDVAHRPAAHQLTPQAEATYIAHAQAQFCAPISHEIAASRAAQVPWVVATVPVNDPSVVTIPGGPRPGGGCRALAGGAARWRGAGPWPGPWSLPPRGRSGLRGPGRPAGPSRSDAQQPGGRRGGPVRCAAPGNERRRQPPPIRTRTRQAASRSRTSASASAGVFQPSVLRGRPFSSSATAARWAGL